MTDNEYKPDVDIFALSEDEQIPVSGKTNQKTDPSVSEETETRLEESAVDEYVAPASEPQQPEHAETTKTASAKSLENVTNNSRGSIRENKIFQCIKNKLFAPREGVSGTRQAAMTILVPVLLVVMVSMFVKVLKGPSRAVAGTEDIQESPVAATREINWEAPKPYPQTLRDPMRISSKTKTEIVSGNLTINGIVYSRDNASAIVGNQIVHEGDKVSGATVMKINADSIEFKMNEKTWTQKM